jgi:hypoxanthine-DNA glycosylase
MENAIHNPLGPIVDERSRIIILGSMPSEISISRREYYANPRNQFWQIMYGVFEAGPPAKAYDERISFLRERRIALWDVASSCIREGSSDSSISDPAKNEIMKLLSAHIKIKYILFNGKKAAGLFETLVHDTPDAGVKLVTMPSTSPAYAAMPMEMKTLIWREEIISDLGP